jgi:hypothetical protein
MTNEFVEIDTLTDAEHAEMHALGDAELDAVAGGLEAKDIILLKWINANFPSLMPSVFTQGTRNVC